MLITQCVYLDVHRVVFGQRNLFVAIQRVCTVLAIDDIGVLCCRCCCILLLMIYENDENYDDNDDNVDDDDEEGRVLRQRRRRWRKLRF